jgi:hypothetical protein
MGRYWRVAAGKAFNGKRESACVTTAALSGCERGVTLQGEARPGRRGGGRWPVAMWHDVGARGHRRRTAHRGPGKGGVRALVRVWPVGPMPHWARGHGGGRRGRAATSRHLAPTS